MPQQVTYAIDGGVVIGPTGATPNNVPVFDGDTGQRIKASGYNIDDDGNLFIPNSASVPTENPVDGITLYVEAGVLKYRKPDGTVVTP
jgi:hypothetical protein